MLHRSIQLAEILKYRKQILGYSNVEIFRTFTNYLGKQSIYNKNLNKIVKWRTYTSKDSKEKLIPGTTVTEKKEDPSTNQSIIDKVSKSKTQVVYLPKEETNLKSITAENLLKKDDLKNEDDKNIKTTKLEVKTSKGILSVTTTVEDAKINDIILEKTSSNLKPTGDLNETKVETKITEPSTIIEDKTVTATKSNAKESKKTVRARIDIHRSSLERNFITPARAMSDFLLKSSDLESLPKIKRRSPYEQEPPITVYWRKDVESKAIQIWGSRENLLRECLKREIEKKKHQQNIFTVKRRLRDYRREIGIRASADTDEQEEDGLGGKSGRVVLIATAINATNFVFKVFAWLYTGSHSMFAESIHSLADTSNQLILAYGIHKSVQSADTEHPYGYSNWRYVSSLISGVGIFCVGTGLSFYHGVQGLMHPEPIQDYFWAFCILGGSLVSEGATLLVAVNEIKRSALKRGISFKEYVLRGQDPCVNVVLMEDAAAVASVGVAATCMAISTYTGNGYADAVGSLLVGTILGGVAAFIIHTNVSALVGKSIPEDDLNKINAELESDVMIRAIHDVKGVDMGNNLIRYKAEVDFDGRELTRSYLDKQDLVDLLNIVKSFQTVDEVEQFLFNHGENIVDLMGGEIDRIEMKLRKKFPELRHCDLEIL